LSVIHRGRDSSYWVDGPPPPASLSTIPLVPILWELAFLFPPPPCQMIANPTPFSPRYYLLVSCISGSEVYSFFHRAISPRPGALQFFLCGFPNSLFVFPPSFLCTPGHLWGRRMTHFVRFLRVGWLSPSGRGVEGPPKRFERWCGSWCLTFDPRKFFEGLTVLFVSPLPRKGFLLGHVVMGVLFLFCLCYPHFPFGLNAPPLRRRFIPGFFFCLFQNRVFAPLSRAWPPSFPFPSFALSLTLFFDPPPTFGFILLSFNPTRTPFPLHFFSRFFWTPRVFGAFRGGGGTHHQNSLKTGWVTFSLDPTRCIGELFSFPLF